MKHLSPKSDSTTSDDNSDSSIDRKYGEAVKKIQDLERSKADKKIAANREHLKRVAATRRRNAMLKREQKEKREAAEVFARRAQIFALEEAGTARRMSYFGRP